MSIVLTGKISLLRSLSAYFVYENTDLRPLVRLSFIDLILLATLTTISFI